MTSNSYRYRVAAQVPVAASVYASLPNGRDEGVLLGKVLAAMNRTAGERNRRVFGNPWIAEVAEADDVVTLTYMADTEPEPR